MDAIDDLARPTGRQPEAKPVDQVVAGEARLLHRGHIGQSFPALGAGQGEHLYLARLRLLRGDLRADEEELDAAGEHIGHHLGHALVLHADDIDAGHRLHQLRRNVARRADAGRAVVELARVLARIGDERLHRLVWRIRRHDQRLAVVLRRERDVREVAHRIEGHVVVERRRIDVRRRREEPGVAICRSFCHVGRADDAAGAGAVLDHERLAEIHFRRQHPDDQVRRSARWGGHDDADRLSRP